MTIFHEDFIEPKYENMYRIARETMEKSYSPYSHIKVGAYIITRNKSYKGFCIENKYKENCCAERVAIYQAVSEGETELLAIAVAGTETVTLPCIKCLHVMEEFAPSIKIIVKINEQLKVYNIDAARRLLYIMKRELLYKDS